MGCVFSVVCRRNSRLGVFGSDLGFERAWTNEQTLLSSGKHPLAGLQKDFLQYGSANFVFRKHEDNIPDEDLAAEVDDYITRFGAFAVHQGYHTDRQDLVPPAPPPPLVKTKPEDSVLAQLKADNEALRLELVEIRRMLSGALPKPDEVIEELVEDVPVKAEVPPPPPPAPKAKPGKGKPVVRIEQGLRTGTFPSIAAAAKAAKVTQREVRAAIRKKSEFKGAFWAFESEVTSA